jgi:YD repeat-containing protein
MSSAMSGRRSPLEMPWDEYFAEGGHSVSDSPAALLAAPLVRQSQPALVGHWAFDEGSGTVAADSSGNGNNATLLNGPTWTQGRVGAGAVSFDGVDDRLTTANPSAVPNNFTVSFWANPDAAHEIDPEGTSGVGGVSGQRYAWWPTFQPGGDAGAGISVGTNGVSVYEHGFSHMPATLVYQAQISGWTHVAVVYENKQPKLYLNGVLVKTGLVSPRNAVWTTPQDVGGNVYGFYDGQLDDVRLYGGAVSAADISALAGTQGTGLTGRYFDNLDFTAYKLTRADAAVNFDWGGGSPDSSVGQDEFSARWTGTVVPSFSETYTFHTTTDDGVRLWVDGQLVIDKWVDQAPTEWSGQMALQAGRPYALRMEFYERGGGAQAKLKWSSASQAKEVIPQARLYGCWKEPDQFARDFYQGALGAQGPGGEVQDWTSQLSQAQGDAQLLAVAQALGAHVFNSQAYAARNRGDADYVSDLYRAYLQREPDQSGLNFWTGQIGVCGTDQQCRAAKRLEVRVAFGGSGEFGEKVRALCGTAASAPANGGSGYNFMSARLDPVNQTGGAGVDPYSRNFNFQIPLVSLPGRAGLDLGLTLSYNSLVWTKDAGGVTFDADRGSPSPGFRLGFPTIQPKFFNPQTGKNAYLLLTSSGARVELRETATPGVYESADSTYLQLTEGGGPSLLSTDGTRLSFALLGGEYRCVQVMDRNGNYLSAAYYADGRMDKVVDTLGRVVTFNYDDFQNLTSITQPWRRETELNPSPTQDEVHEWATFGYENVTLQPQFSDLAVIGEQPGAVVPAVNQVGLADGSFYRFKYNEWGQVWKVTRYAADSRNAGDEPDESHPLTSTRLDLPGSVLSPATAQTDCPRFKQELLWVEHGVMGQSAEVSTQYGEWAPGMASCEVTLPDGTTKQVSTYGAPADGWKKGLTTKNEVWSGSQLVKTTTLAWEHDGGAAAPYATNPRVTQTTVSDPQGHGRTTRITYTSPEDFRGESGYTGTLNLRLPRKVEECDLNCARVLRTAVTDYKVSNLAEYVQHRILGLARFTYLYDGAEAGANLRSLTGFVYDELNGAQDTFLAALSAAASQHAPAYAPAPDANGQGGLRWRGNANRARRYSVDQATGAVGPFVERRAGFNVTGTVAYTKDAAGHKTSISYEDAFLLNINRTHTDPQFRLKTYAYPTTVIDPGAISASTGYNYDMGVTVRGRAPKPNVTTDELDGPAFVSLYDAAGRLVKTSNSVNGAYTQTVYDRSMKLVGSFTTVADESLQNLNTRAYSAAALDGLGRVRGTARDFPGSAGPAPVGTYSAQIAHYDAAGRPVFQSNPTEMRIEGGAWTPAGDDANGGLWMGRTTVYDWKGRPRFITEPKLNPNDPNEQPATREFEYGGCGCAGGEVVTERNALVTIPDTPNQGRRTRRAHSDPLGRVWKTEVLNWDGTVYAATTTKYDASDRPLRVRQYAGPAPLTEPAGEGAGYQTTTMAYDGHGRLKTRHLPSFNPDAVATFVYNDDDTVQSVTDPRTAVASFTYNNRHLITHVAFDPAQSGAPDTPDVFFAYDAAGNRTSMTDESGALTYQYDALSRLASERKQFNGITHRTYELTYSYNLAGQLKSLTDPFGAVTTYSRDTVGQVTDVTGSGYAAIPQFVHGVQFASGIKYRAWGAVRTASYGDGRGLTVGYDTRLRVTSFQMPGPITLNKTYQYDADGALRFADDLMDDVFDRSYSYDHAGRLTEAHTGTQARGGQVDDGPYQQSYTYDPFDHNTGQNHALWGDGVLGGGGQYQNDRRQGWGYDAAGNLTNDQLRQYVSDAAGQLKSLDFGEQTYAYDGNGRVARVARQSPTLTTYNLYSTALGEVVSQLTPHTSSPDARQDIVYAGGAVVRHSAGGTDERVTWSHEDAAGTTRQEGGASPFGAFINPIVELDPVRASVGTADPDQFGELPPPPDETSPELLATNNARRPGMTCLNNFIIVDCEQLLPVIEGRTGRRSVPGVRSWFVRDYTSSFGFQDHSAGQSQAVDEGEAVRIDSNEIPLWRLVSQRLIKSESVGGGMSPSSPPSPRPETRVVASNTKQGVCSIELVTRGPMSPGNELLFPSGREQRLGSVDNALGWFWQVEVRGTVRGDASRWYLGQRASVTLTGSYLTPTGETENLPGKPELDMEDAPEPQFRRQRIGQSNFFFLDGPGLFKSLDRWYLSANLVQNFYTYVERGNNRCGIKWSLTIRVRDNQLKSIILRPYHVPMR